MTRVKYIDIGNTHTKLLSGSITKIYYTESLSIDEISAEFLKSDLVVISSVVPKALEQIKKILFKTDTRHLVLDNKVKFSFSSEVEGTGVDRLLAIQGALQFFHPPMVVVDVGTAITIDFVQTSESFPVYKGGVIIPGFDASLSSLLKMTSQLPNIKIHQPEDIIGKNTNDALNTGTCLSIAHGVKGIIESYKSKYKIEELQVCITGGGANFLYRLIKDYTNCSFCNNLHLSSSLVFDGMKDLTKTFTSNEERVC